MAVSAANANSLRVPKQQTVQATVLPAPLGGMDTRVPLAIDSPNTCLWAINMVPNEYSMRVRNGYREWQIGLGSAVEVRSTIPYIGTQSSGAINRLFCATTNGIYEVTDYGQPPVLKIAFDTQSDESGRGVYMASVDESGDDFMFYADQENGLFHYDPATNTWSKATGITAASTAIGTLNLENVVFVNVHKLRIWLIEKDANKAWYLPIRSAAGEAKEFFFAQKFRYGGDLVGLYNWTVDGGMGRDDHLVAISRGGDVIPYTGEDPADINTWTSTGTFYIGPVPSGHRVASEYGGELYVLSRFGITSMSGLLSGQTTADPMSDPLGQKIARLLRADLDEYGQSDGWSVRFVADIGSMLITVPKRADGRYRQYVYNITTKGWGLWRDVPIISCGVWDGVLHFGDGNGRVLRMDQTRDEITIAGDTGQAIDWFVLTSYSHLEAPAQFKRAKLIRPNFVAETEPLYEVYAVYDYIQSEQTPVSGAPAANAGSVWDTGLWGDALWSVSTLEPFSRVLGAAGVGRSIAVALVGSSVSRTDLASIDLMWDTGGAL